MSLLDSEGDLARRLAEQKRNVLVAQRVMDQMADMEARPLPEVQKAVVPASGFSGDRLVAERTPAGVLHVFLADGVGHGLVPALLALPLTQLFSAMSRKGFNLPAIVAELNRKIGLYRLPGQFVAVTLAAYDPAAGHIEVWNGGNPDGLLLARDGLLLRRFPSRNLPLGLASAAELDTRTDCARVPDGAELLLFSDGLPEAEGRDNSRFGEARLLECASRQEPGMRLDAVLSEVRRHLGGREAHDDISLLVLGCQREAAVAATADRPAVAAERASGEWAGRAQWSFTLRLDAETLRLVDAVPVIQNLLRDVHAGGDYSRQFVVLSELFNNALDHGLLQLDSSLKNGADGMAEYLAERARRLAALEQGEIVVELSSAVGEGRRALRLKVQDSGQGFAHAAALAPSPEGAAAGADSVSAPGPAPYGRGIALVRMLADEFRYLGSGNIAEALCFSQNNKEAA
jgi:hypothetical protein